MDFLPGRLVKSLAGHDKDKVYVLLKEEEDVLFVSDGRYKPVEEPKKKKKKHVQLSHETSLCEMMKQGKMPKNEDIIHTLRTEE